MRYRVVFIDFFSLLRAIIIRVSGVRVPPPLPNNTLKYNVFSPGSKKMAPGEFCLVTI